MKKTQRLRQLIEAPEILALPAVHDGFSARIVEYSGFASAFITGSGVSESRLGQPDVGIMGLEENVAAARAIAACSDLILLADGDTGYGNAINAYHTVRAFEQAGVAGLMLEDQVWPKRCGHMKGKEVIAMDEMVEKIRAAAEARIDPGFVIKSRTDALATHGLDEAIKRLNAYAEAGADLLFADALLTREQIATVVRNVSKPLCVNMGFGIRQRSTTPLLSAQQLQELGVAVVIFPRMLTACALMGMKNGLALLRQSLDSGVVIDRPDAAVSFEELNEIMGMAQIQRLEQKFLTPAQRQAKYRGDASAHAHEEPATAASARPIARLPAGAVDCHAHVMRRDIGLVAERHSAPAHDFSLADYLAVLDRHGVASAVLTAPSFYGANNTLLLQALAAANGRLRGTVIVDPDIGAAELRAMRDQGVTGIRLNWIKRERLPDVASADHRRLFDVVADLDMHVEVYLEGELLKDVLPHVLRSKAKLVLDHFGCPEPRQGVRSDGFQYVLKLLAEGNTWVKLSAPYRQGGADIQAYVDALLKAGGAERLVWATDWPWVKFEEVITYQQCIDWIFEWVPHEATRNAILVDTPRKLFGFD